MSVDMQNDLSHDLNSDLSHDTATADFAPEVAVEAVEAAPVLSFDTTPVKPAKKAAPSVTFESLGLHAQVVRALTNSGYTEPTPVQAAAIPAALAGKDLMVSAATGSGKTAAFLLPALHRLAVMFEAAGAFPTHTIAEAIAAPVKATDEPQFEAREGGYKGKRFNKDKGASFERSSKPGVRIDRPAGPRVLVLTPTRELAQQVSKAVVTYGATLPGVKMCSITGGAAYELQLRMLRGPIDIVVATPGRLMDHMRSGKIDLRHIELLVLDEADRMLDMGFIDDITAIAAATRDERQTVMFSATFDGGPAKLAQRLLRDPQRIELSNVKGQQADIEQRLHWADNREHKDALLDSLLCDRELKQAIVFTATQQDADQLAAELHDKGHSVAPLHGGMPQGRRNRTLRDLREGQIRILIATDVAARGIDVPTISHVINYGLPMNPEDYVHRIGRTGRAGRSGLAITLANHREAFTIKRIEQFMSKSIPQLTIAGLEPKTQPARNERRGGGGGRPERFGGRPQQGFGGRDGNRDGGGRDYSRDNSRGSGSGYAGAGGGFRGNGAGNNSGNNAGNSTGYQNRGASQGGYASQERRDDNRSAPAGNSFGDRSGERSNDRGFDRSGDRNPRGNAFTGKPAHGAGFAGKPAHASYPAKPGFGAKPAYAGNRDNNAGSTYAKPRTARPEGSGFGAGNSASQGFDKRADSRAPDRAPRQGGFGSGAAISTGSVGGPGNGGFGAPKRVAGEGFAAPRAPRVVTRTR